ncbi:MAG: circadian clock protein KaiC [Gammaproteobacteria bacterium]
MSSAHAQLPKAHCGIAGLDEITGGGFPAGRPTLLCGGPGCGKTLLALQFLVHGATACDEPGVFMAFEETARDLTRNVASLGIDLDALSTQGKLKVDHIHVDRHEMTETGDYDLEGLFIRLGHAIDSIGAKRVALDTIETLFAGFSNEAILRAELRRLFLWLKERGVTTLITGESGERTLTRQGLEEYVSDCVIALDHRIVDQISSRRLRVVKYRGSTHGTNEYPFLIDEDGISVLPVTSLVLDHEVSSERVSSGVPALDAMLGDAGYFRGSSVLVSGTAGTGKSSLAAHFAAAACKRGERVLYFPFEESPAQIERNMLSIGLDLHFCKSAGLLHFDANRPSLGGLEMHLLRMRKMIAACNPQVVIVDPLNSFIAGGNRLEVKLMLLRLVDYLKSRHITALFTNLTAGGDHPEETDTAISSLIDTWLLLQRIHVAQHRQRTLEIIKSRGMAHSDRISAFRLTAHGIALEALTGDKHADGDDV